MLYRAGWIFVTSPHTITPFHMDKEHNFILQIKGNKRLYVWEPDDVETLQRMVRRLAAERTALSEAQAEIERLRLIVRKLQRSQFGRRAERLDDDQLQLGFEDLGVDIARAEATLPPGAAKSSRVRSQTDRPSLPAHLPREEMRLDLGYLERRTVTVSTPTARALPTAY